MHCRYRVVVSIDGGGIRGILPLRLIEHIQETISLFDKTVNPSSWIDLYGATSTGTIISGALMVKDEKGGNKHSPKDIMSMYLRRGEQIFAKSPQQLTSKHKYPLTFVLDHFFGTTTLDQLDKRFIFFSYDLNGDEPFYFTDGMDHMRTMALSKMMTACSAFPGVFPPLKMGQRLLADGILATKNPSKMAYNYARMFYPEDPIILISLGAGVDESMDFDLFETEANKTHDEMEHLSKTDKKLLYFRFQPEINHASKDISDATVANTQALLKDADHYIQSNDSQFDRLFSLMKIRVDQYF